MSDIQIGNLGNLSTLAQRQYYSRPADERFENIDALETAVLNRRNRSIQFDTDIKSFQFKELDGDVVVMTRDEIAVPTHYSFGQTAGLVKAPAEFLRRLGKAGRNDLVVENLNASLALRDTEGVKALLIDGDDKSTLQAVTSQTFGRIWDADVVAATRQILDAHPEFTNPPEWSGRKGGLYASDHDIFLLFVTGGSLVDGGPDLLSGGDRDVLHRGFIVINSEVGSSFLLILTFLFRVVCGNHLLIGVEGVKVLRIRHSSGGPARWVNEAIPALTEYVNASAKPVEAAIRKAKSILLPAKDEEFFSYFTSRGFTRAETKRAKTFAEVEEGGSRTLWQVINGFTRQARDIPFQDAKVNLERRAGKLLDALAEAA